ncbi:phosphoribosylamine--glycine ligase [Chloroflexota bacterium]
MPKIKKETLKLKILVIGGGAREHALTWKIIQSSQAEEVYVAPGNAGTAQIAHNLDINPSDTESLLKTVKEKDIGLVVVGPEDPLGNGIVDRFQKEGIPIFGPSQAAAQIEISKIFAKELMQKYKIPTARSQSFSNYSQAGEYVQNQKAPLVIKADGLAAGKGVIVATSKEEALDALTLIMKNRAFGDAGNRVLVEEYLSGREMSALAFTDGTTIVPMAAACDYKAAFDGDAGPNTGGMGSYSPPHFYKPGLAKKILNTIMAPTVEAMRSEKQTYRGVLYSGLMLTDKGLKVLEFNARFGDPETQVILPLLKTDIVDIFRTTINGNLDKINVEWSEDACVGVVMVSAGYPGKYKTGLPITGLDDLDKDIMVFHAGTKTGSDNGEVLTSGGRVLTVVATGETISTAREKIYNNLPRIHFEGCRYRRDIATTPQTT